MSSGLRLARDLLLGALCLSAGAPAVAGVITVDDDGPANYSSIQAAINAAYAGDEIVVEPGLYHETLSFLGKAITVRSADGPANTVVFLEGQTRIVRLDGNSTLRGLTIRGGGRTRTGAGILVTGGVSPTIEGNIIENNTATWDDVTGFPAFGAGIHIELNSNPTITRNVIRNNRAQGAADGAYGYGGAIDMDDGCSATITNNLIVNNVATDTGGGISLAGLAGQTTPVVIANNTIVGNRAGLPGTNSFSYGGGITVENGAKAVIRNNAITDNSAAFSGGGIYFFATSLSGITYQTNDFNANAPDNCAGLPAAKCYGGQFTFAPLYEDAAAGVRQLRSDSELIDLGTTTGAPAVDLLGRARSVDSDMDGAAAPDIGAYENQAEITRMRFDNKTTLRWDASSNLAIRFDVYRDRLALLGPGGLGLCWRPGLATTTTSDSDPILPGDGFFYLARGRDRVVGSLGFTSGGVQRTASQPCP